MNCQYIFGGSFNTKGISSQEGYSATETTLHSPLDVSQSKSYAYGNNEVSSKSQGDSLFRYDFQGVSTKGEALQNGTGGSLTDSWSKNIAADRKTNYFKYLEFLQTLLYPLEIAEPRKFLEENGIILGNK